MTKIMFFKHNRKIKGFCVLRFEFQGFRVSEFQGLLTGVFIFSGVRDCFVIQSFKFQGTEKSGIVIGFSINI